MTAARLRAHWLMKSEPGVFSIDDLAARRRAGWDGVRNYQARNHMRAMRRGDLVIFYHSNAAPSGAAGLAEVVGEAYPDPTQFDRDGAHFEPRARPEAPVWLQVDLAFRSKFPRFLSLDELRARPELSGMELFRRSRLSVQPVSGAHFSAVLRLAGSRLPA